MHVLAASRASTASGMLQLQRLVLYPYGPPQADDVRERCAEFLLSQRGDLRRVIDAPLGSLDRFCAYLRRISALQGNGERPLVVLTRSSPMWDSVVQARIRMQRELPVLRRATWAILVDRRMDPEFETAARQLGTLQFDSQDEGTWIGPQNLAFAVVCVGSPAGTDGHERLSSAEHRACRPGPRTTAVGGFAVHSSSPRELPSPDCHTRKS